MLKLVYIFKETGGETLAGAAPSESQTLIPSFGHAVFCPVPPPPIFAQNNTGNHNVTTSCQSPSFSLRVKESCNSICLVELVM